MAEVFNGIPVPEGQGQKITYQNGRFQVPDNPIIPFIEGDGTGRDIWKASVRVFDAAVNKAYGGKRSIAWYEVCRPFSHATRMTLQRTRWRSSRWACVSKMAPYAHP